MLIDYNVMMLSCTKSQKTLTSHIMLFMTNPYNIIIGVCQLRHLCLSRLLLDTCYAAQSGNLQFLSACQYHADTHISCCLAFHQLCLLRIRVYP